MTRRYHAVGNQISQYIYDAGLSPGTRLPGEIDLARLCGVSRPVLREALVAMEVTGDLERNRSGAFVGVPKPISLGFHSGPSPFEILRARILIEGSTATNAATFASALDLSKMEQTMRQIETELAQDASSLALDRQFHLAVAEASKNSAITAIVDGLWSQMFAPKYHQLSYQVNLRRSRIAALQGQKAVFQAIAGRNPQHARRTMKTHLQHLEIRLLESE